MRRFARILLFTLSLSGALLLPGCCNCPQKTAVTAMTPH